MQFVILFLFILQVKFVSAQEGSCREGLHGNNCELKCSSTCQPLETYPCNKATGKCSEGCKTGFYGTTCNKTCVCAASCIQETGACIGGSTVTTTSKDTDNGDDSSGGETNIWFFIAIALIILVVLMVVAFILYICYIRRRQNFSRERRRERKPQDSTELRQLLTSNQSSKRTSNPGKMDKGAKKRLDEAEEKKIKLLEEERDKIRVAEHNRIFQQIGFPPNSSYQLIKKTEFKKGSWLQCITLTFDKKKVNTKTNNIDGYGKMSNKEDVTDGFEGKTRFQYYNGTTTTEPVFLSEFPQFFEVDINIHLDKSVGEKEILLDLGFSTDNDLDQGQFTPDRKKCYSLKMIHCDIHKKICIWILRDGKLEEDYETSLGNSVGASISMQFGILLHDKKKLTFIDHQRSSFKTIQIEIGNEIWPTFGLAAQNSTNSNLRLLCGFDIKMTEEKLKTIQNALK